MKYEVHVMFGDELNPGWVKFDSNSRNAYAHLVREGAEMCEVYKYSKELDAYSTLVSMAVRRDGLILRGAVK